jgi:peroxiredoxin (alkyl hydroperoxide reductase subunit C)
MPIRRIMTACLLVLISTATPLGAQENQRPGNIFDPGQLTPIDSRLKVQAGDPAPDFTLPAVSGRSVRLSQFRGQKNVVLSFVPAAWTPVCSGQWPGYNLVEDLFNANDTIMLGITVDNIPTLHAWTREMGGLWFDVLSDFWPHGAVADAYGVLRSDGTAERALIFIDKQGIISSAMVFDINERPDLKVCVDEVEKLGQP